jgi:hypothetical protein
VLGCSAFKLGIGIGITAKEMNHQKVNNRHGLKIPTKD